jgi:hypothetical protein
LGVLSAAAALLVIWLSNDLLVAAAKAAGLPRAAEIGIRVPVFAFACGAALLAAILSALMPAFHATRGRGNLPIGEHTRSATSSRDRHWFRAGLLASEAALSLILLSAAALLAGSFLQLQSTNPGFDARGVYTARLSLPSARYPAGPVMASFRQQMLDQLAAAPGIQSAAVVDWLPLSGMGAGVGFHRIESAVAEKGSPSAELVISPDYFRTPSSCCRTRCSMPGIWTRLPTWSSAVAGAAISEISPGQRLVIDSREPVTCTIVGVVGDMHQYNLREAPSPEIFAPFTQHPWMLHDTRDFVIRSGLAPAAATAFLRRLIRQMEPDIPFNTALPMEEVIELWFGGFYSAAFGVFAAAHCSAAFGIWAVGAVAERTQEIGIGPRSGRNWNVVRWLRHKVHCRHWSVSLQGAPASFRPRRRQLL